MTTNYIIIDGSYFIFYRYYALLQWWKVSKQEPSLELMNPCENERFINMYKTTFIKKIQEIPKKLKISNPVYIVGKDCPREKIWRNKLIDNYKGERKKENYIGFFFEITYSEKLFEQANINYIMEYPELEADDCNALTIKYLCDMYEKSNDKLNIYIIANDMDYIQLCEERINIYDLKYKRISNIINKSEAEKYLFCKILMGDKSDNIPSIFPNCGIKTAIKCYEDETYFKKKLNNNEYINQLYERNKNLIDFNNIPQDLVNGFLQLLQNTMN